MIILPSGETLIWKAVDISDQRGRAIDVIPKIEEILNDLKEQSIKVAALVSDSTAAYASAHILKNASTDAVKLVNYFNHPNNIYFIGKLRNIQQELYSKYYAIIRPGDTRWNSYYKCYLNVASIILGWIRGKSPDCTSLILSSGTQLFLSDLFY
ncbi:unnamed protein product [Rhizophagus irregularis]|nr:unnamed protein product [Rhizophagus irregularis]